MDTDPLRWAFPTHGPIRCGLTVCGDLVVAASDNGSVYGIDITTGKRRWEVTGAVCMERSSPAVADGRVFIYTTDHCLVALNAVNGAVLWRREGLGGEPGSSPRVAGEVVLCGRWRVSGVVADSGDDAWSPGPVSSMFPRYSKGNGDCLYVTTRNLLDSARLWELNAPDGRLRSLKYTLRSLNTSPVTGHGLVYVANGSGTLLAFNPRDQAIRWQSQMGPRLRWTPDYRPCAPCLAGERIWAVGPDKKVHAWDARDGSEHQAFGDNVRLWCSPVAVDDVVCVLATDGSVYALTGDNPPCRWVLRTGTAKKGPAMAAPVTAGGMLYVGSPDRYVYAFEVAQIPENKHLRYSEGEREPMGNQYDFHGPVIGNPHIGDGGTHTYHADPQLIGLAGSMLNLLADYEREQGVTAPAGKEVAELRAEIAKPDPNRSRIRSLLSTVATAATSVTALAEAAREVLRLLGS